eukprot:scaffold280861_cov18-Tisochrysis_lutea.AAC.1
MVQFCSPARLTAEVFVVAYLASGHAQPKGSIAMNVAALPPLKAGPIEMTYQSNDVGVQSISQGSTEHSQELCAASYLQPAEQPNYLAGGSIPL